jgi:hypothetical protein
MNELKELWEKFLGAAPSVAVAARSGPASPRTAAGSDVLPPAEASSSGHVLPAAPRSSPDVAADSSVTKFRFVWAELAAATNSPSCRPAGAYGYGSSAFDLRPRPLLMHFHFVTKLKSNFNFN